ncbi:hypothetical protein ACFX4I_12675 [Peribacillus sp. YIM B13472]|nr:hypothetical protein [Peribacillus simplex]MDR4925493.1 hypothetical protein [Peribacillus simplex]
MEDQVRAADSGKEKNSARVPSFPILHIHFKRCSSELSSVITINHHIFTLSCFQWPVALYIYTNHDNARDTPADPLAGILLLPIATLLSFYV